MARAARPAQPAATRQPRDLFWLGAAVQGAAVALVAYVGSSIISAAATSFVLTLGMAFEQHARFLSTFTL